MLPTNKTTVTGEAAEFVARVRHAPPLVLVGELVKNSVLVEGVPQTPAARRTAVDRALFNPQHKMELVLHRMATTIERCPDPSTRQEIQAMAALVRSSYEDINESRRRLIAGRQQDILQRRTDVTDNRLLSEAEEQKLRQRQTTGRSLGKGKGKGKGKGYSSRPYRPGQYAVSSTQLSINESRPAEHAGKGKGNTGGNRPFRGRSKEPR